MKPIVFDLCCGLGGWSEAFIAQGYLAIGFDIEAHDYGNGSYPGELVLRDIRSISGGDLVREYGAPVCIVASPPCQEFSYMAMPWSKAKDKERKILADPEEQKRLTDLFNQCFRIQREVSEAAGRYVPIIIENVRGAQKWVGKARWNFGSFYLWGDVPALMPIPGTRKWDSDHLAKSEAHKTSGKQALEGIKQPSKNGRRTNIGNGTRFSRDCGNEGSKGNWLERDPITGKRILKGQRATSSKSKARKRAAAEIAKIPPALAEWIAKCFKPHKILASTREITEKQGD